MHHLGSPVVNYAEAPMLWPPDTKSQLIGKDPDARTDWGQEKGTTEGEMIGWHHRLTGHEFGQTLGSGEGQGRLACGSPWGLKRVSHNLVTEQQQRWKAFKISFVGGGVLSGGHDQWHIDIVKEQESVNSGYLWRVKLLWFSFSSGKHITCAVFRAFFRNCWRSLKIF